MVISSSSRAKEKGEKGGGAIIKEVLPAGVPLNPRSMVTGELLVSDGNKMAIIDKFWDLKKENAMSEVIPISQADALGKIWKEKSTKLFEQDESRRKHAPHSSSSSASSASLNSVDEIDRDTLLKGEEVLRIMKKILPSETKVSEECLQGMQRCAAEFASLVSNEAGVVTLCESQQQRIILDGAGSRVTKGSDVTEALDSLGFPDYAKVISIHLNKFRHQKTQPLPKPVVGIAKKMSGSAYEEQLKAEGELLDSREEAARLKKARKK